MKAIIQRVISASVTVDGQVVSSISNGILVFAAIAPNDTLKDIDTLANRILKLKVWDDNDGGSNGRWKNSVIDMKYQILLVPQFTLLANTKKGNKPDFHGACPSQMAKDMYTSLLEKTRELYIKDRQLPSEEGIKWVQDGVFGAMMQVALINDGPVTLEINTPSPQQQSTNSTEKGSGEGSQKGSAKGTPKEKGAPKGRETPTTEALGAGTSPLAEAVTAKIEGC